jgi:hypothetical protein
LGEAYVTHRGNWVKVFGGEVEGRRLLGSTWRRWNDSTKIHLKK